MAISDVGKFVEELFQWEPHRVSALVTGLLLGASISLWVWRQYRGSVRDLGAQVKELRQENDRLWEKNSSLKENVEELRTKLNEIKDRVPPKMAVELKETLQDIAEEQEEDEALPNEKQKLRFSILPAYAFGDAHGLQKEMNDIRKMAIEWERSYSTSVRKGYLIDLFEKRGLFDKFKAQQWQLGNTAKGERERQRILRIKEDYEAFLAARSATEGVAVGPA